jgi:5'-deoxynucleotidase YfbR-like HD superfamily hydrolase
VAAEQERDAFGRQHFGALAAEMVPLDAPVAERLANAWAELQAAERAYAERVRVWTKLAPFGDLTAEDVPRLPTSGDADTVRSRFAAGIPAPTPWPLRRAVEATEAT